MARKQQAASYNAQPGVANGAMPPLPQPIQQPIVNIESIAVTPNAITGGSEVTIKATYVAYGPRVEPPTGTLQLMRDNQVLASSPLEIGSTGRVEISKTLSIPADAASGPYVVVIVLQHGPSTAQQASTFNVI